MNFFEFFLNFIILKFKKSFSLPFFLCLFFFVSFIFSQANQEANQGNNQTTNREIKTKEALSQTNLDSTLDSNLVSITNSLNQNSNQEISFTGFYIRTIIILGIGFLILYFGIKMVSKKKKNRIENDIVEVIFEYPLFLNRQIVIAKIFEEYYILGVTSDNISLIDKITEQSQIELLLKNQIDKKQGKFSFKKVLEQMLATPKTKNKKDFKDILNLKDKIDKI